jgi:hypothetical protein
MLLIDLAGKREVHNLMLALLLSSNISATHGFASNPG